MITMQKIEKMTICCVLAAIFSSNGCGIVGVVGTPSAYEKKIPAEYDLTSPAVGGYAKADLAEQKGKKILVLVEQPGWLSTEVNLRYYLTEAIRESFIANVKIPPEYIISYKELSEFRSNKSDFSSLSPVAVGEALGVDIVLLVMIEDYQLNEMPETDYYNGFLGAQAILFETATGVKLWPESAMGKSIRVSFEAERNRDAAVDRLVNACAHCITRFFYNCPKYKFKIFDEGIKAGWEE
jgi:hypothetical protein